MNSTKSGGELRCSGRVISDLRQVSGCLRVLHQ